MPYYLTLMHEYEGFGQPHPARPADLVAKTILVPPAGNTCSEREGCHFKVELRSKVMKATFLESLHYIKEVNSVRMPVNQFKWSAVTGDCFSWFGKSRCLYFVWMLLKDNSWKTLINDILDKSYISLKIFLNEFMDSILWTSPTTWSFYHTWNTIIFLQNKIT